VGEANGASDGNGEDPLEPLVGEVPPPVAELAESARTFVLSAIGVELDYEPETLPVLDAYVQTARRGVGDRPEALPVVAQAIGAYFGEVLRRRVDGFWRHRGDPNDPWEVCGRRALFQVSPLGIALECLAESDEHEGPSAELRLAPEDDALARERTEAMPPVPESEYYLFSTRLEVIEAVVETLRERMREEGRESLVFEESDYEDE
jgi:hypothetical protein